MQINIPDWVFPEVRNDMISLIKYIADEYISDHDMMELDVTIGENENFGGLANVVDDEEDFPIFFEIDLDNELMFDTRELLITIAHEMIHIKQFATGDLRNCPRSIKYKNRYYRLKDGKIDPKKYRDYPWEQEAYEMEMAVYRNWLAHKG